MPTIIAPESNSDFFNINGHVYPAKFLVTLLKSENGKQPVRLISVGHPSIQVPLIPDLYDTTIDGTDFSFSFSQLTNRHFLEIVSGTSSIVDPKVLNNARKTENPFLLLQGTDADVNDFEINDRLGIGPNQEIVYRVVAAPKTITYATSDFYETSYRDPTTIGGFTGNQTAGWVRFNSFRIQGTLSQAQQDAIANQPIVFGPSDNPTFTSRIHPTLKNASIITLIGQRLDLDEERALFNGNTPFRIQQDPITTTGIQIFIDRPFTQQEFTDESVSFSNNGQYNVYLASTASSGGLTSSRNQLQQIVFKKGGGSGGETVYPFVNAESEVTTTTKNVTDEDLKKLLIVKSTANTTLTVTASPTSFNSFAVYNNSPTSGVNVMVNDSSSNTIGSVPQNELITFLYSPTNLEWVPYSNFNATSSDLATIQTNLSDARTRLSTAETNITNNDNDITGLDTRLGTAETNIGNNDNDISGLTTRLGTAESSITSQGTDIGRVTTTADENRQLLTTYGQDIGANEGRLDTLEGQYPFINGTTSVLTNRFDITNARLKKLIPANPTADIRVNITATRPTTLETFTIYHQRGQTQTNVDIIVQDGSNVVKTITNSQVVTFLFAPDLGTSGQWIAYSSFEDSDINLTQLNNALMTMINNDDNVLGLRIAGLDSRLTTEEAKEETVLTTSYRELFTIGSYHNRNPRLYIFKDVRASLNTTDTYFLKKGAKVSESFTISHIYYNNTHARSEITINDFGTTDNHRTAAIISDLGGLGSGDQAVKIVESINSVNASEIIFNQADVMLREGSDTVEVVHKINTKADILKTLDEVERQHEYTLNLQKLNTNWTLTTLGPVTDEVGSHRINIRIEPLLSIFTYDQAQTNDGIDLDDIVLTKGLSQERIILTETADTQITAAESGQRQSLTITINDVIIDYTILEELVAASHAPSQPIRANANYQVPCTEDGFATRRFIEDTSRTRYYRGEAMGDFKQIATEDDLLNADRLFPIYEQDHQIRSNQLVDLYFGDIEDPTTSLVSGQNTITINRRLNQHALQHGDNLYILVNKDQARGFFKTVESEANQGITYDDVNETTTIIFTTNITDADIALFNDGSARSGTYTAHRLAAKLLFAPGSFHLLISGDITNDAREGLVLYSNEPYSDGTYFNRTLTFSWYDARHNETHVFFNEALTQAEFTHLTNNGSVSLDGKIIVREIEQIPLRALDISLSNGKLILGGLNPALFGVSQRWTGIKQGHVAGDGYPTWSQNHNHNVVIVEAVPRPNDPDPDNIGLTKNGDYQLLTINVSADVGNSSLNDTLHLDLRDLVKKTQVNPLTVGQEVRDVYTDNQSCSFSNIVVRTGGAATIGRNTLRVGHRIVNDYIHFYFQLSDWDENEGDSGDWVVRGKNVAQSYSVQAFKLGFKLDY